MTAACRIPAHVKAMPVDSQNSMSQKNRAFLGFLIAPLSPCVLIFIIAMFQGGGGRGAELLFILILPTSYITSLFIGGPIYYLLNKLNKTNILYYISSAIIASIVPIFFVFFYASLINDGILSLFNGILPVHYGIMGLMTLVGVIISATFWLIARPDKFDRPVP